MRKYKNNQHSQKEISLPPTSHNIEYCTLGWPLWYDNMDGDPKWWVCIRTETLKRGGKENT